MTIPGGGGATASLSQATDVLLIDGTWINLTVGTLGVVIDPLFNDPVNGDVVTPGDAWMQFVDALGQAYACPMRSVAAVKLTAPVTG